MKPDQRFLKQSKSFWAYVRTISAAVGYTDKKGHEIKAPQLSEIQAALETLDLDPTRLLLPVFSPN